MQETQARDMSEKLKEDYERSQKQGNLGHVIGFYNEKDVINETYEFPKGKFTIRSRHETFFWWNYNAKNKRKNERPRFHKRF